MIPPDISETYLIAEWLRELTPQNKALLLVAQCVAEDTTNSDWYWSRIQQARPIDWIGLVMQMKRLLDKVHDEHTPNA